MFSFSWFSSPATSVQTPDSAPSVAPETAPVLIKDDDFLVIKSEEDLATEKADKERIEKETREAKEAIEREQQERAKLESQRKQEREDLEAKILAATKSSAKTEELLKLERDKTKVLSRDVEEFKAKNASLEKRLKETLLSLSNEQAKSVFHIAEKDRAVKTVNQRDSQISELKSQIATLNVKLKQFDEYKNHLEASEVIIKRLREEIKSLSEYAQKRSESLESPRPKVGSGSRDSDKDKDKGRDRDRDYSPRSSSSFYPPVRSQPKTGEQKRVVYGYGGG